MMRSRPRITIGKPMRRNGRMSGPVNGSWVAAAAVAGVPSVGAVAAAATDGWADAAATDGGVTALPLGAGAASVVEVVLVGVLVVEVDVEVVLEGEGFVALAPAGGEELAVAARARVGPPHDEGGVVEDAVAVEHEDRDGAGAAAGELHRAPVHAGDVPLLAVGDAGVVERPAGLLAEVAERDGDEGRHPGVARMLAPKAATAPHGVAGRYARRASATAAASVFPHEARGLLRSPAP